MNWICCQLGAREHYAVARALHAVGSLSALVTEAWVPPAYPLSWGRRMRERFHVDLTEAPIYSWNLGTISFELSARIRRQNGWPLILERNHWFQQRAVDILSKFVRCSTQTAQYPPVVFAYSYAAREILAFAREHGWFTVLGQIDPGPPEERIVARIYEENPAYCSDWRPAPPEYWSLWNDECRLADRIVVNSSWARDALVQEGHAAEKIRIIPLAFDKASEVDLLERSYPIAFSNKRPMRVLFLGQVNLRKGVASLLDAARLLQNEPVEFWFVGPVQIVVPTEFQNNVRIRWFGAMPRGDVSKYYKEADVFIFPSFSDGFGLTQLEAQAWKLPVIASRFCGDVVDGLNGMLLSEVTGKAIAEVVLNLLHNPYILKDMAANSGIASRFTLDSLASSLLNL